MAVKRSRKKNRRRLAIDGVVYRYAVAGDDGFAALTARPEGSRGRPLWVKFAYHDDWVPTGPGSSWSAGHRVVTPRVVRLAVLDGLRRGWNPADAGPEPFRVYDGDGLLPPEEWPRFARPVPFTTPPAAPAATRTPPPLRVPAAAAPR